MTGRELEAFQEWQLAQAKRELRIGTLVRDGQRHDAELRYGPLPHPTVGDWVAAIGSYYFGRPCR